jgi:cupin 2 domain-containing protein
MQINLFDYPNVEKEETFDTLFQNDNIKISRIVSSDSVEIKEYIQSQDEWVIVLEGKATLEVDKKEITLTKGEHIFIKAYTPHSVIKTRKNTLWLAIYC